MSPDLPPQADVVIVGSGPAGLAAATVLARAGVGVLVLEREAAAGGVPRHCAHSPYGLREFRRPMPGPAYAARLLATARAAGADVRTAVSVTELLPGPVVAVTSDAGPARIAARAVLLATGVRESSRAQRLIGGTRPQGVMSTGTLQTLVAAGHRPFARPAILGTELVSFSAILTCRAAGIRPVAMIEPGRRITARQPAGLFPRLLGIPLHLSTDVAQVLGRDRVTGLALTGTGDRTIAADGLIVTGRFLPEAALLAGSALDRDPGTGGPVIDQFGRCSVPGYFAAGNLLRAVETAGWCWAEGGRVAGAMLAWLDGRLGAPDGVEIARAGAVAGIVPQRIASSDLAPALDRVQVRVAAATSGRLSLHAGGTEVAGRRLRALPERRLLLPLPPQGAADPTVALRP